MKAFGNMEKNTTEIYPHGSINIDTLNPIGSDGGEKPKKKKKKVKKQVIGSPSEPVADLFGVIGNKDRMLDEPVDTNQDSKKKKKKKKKKVMSDTSSVSLDSFDVHDTPGFTKMSMGSSSSSSSGSSSSGSMTSGGSYAEREEFAKKKREEEIKQEKFVLLTRISSLSKKGVVARKKFKMEDPIDDIRFECYRMTREKNAQKAIKNMQQMLVSAATFVEFANMMFNPFNLKLQGFSKNMLLTVSDYDDSLEEIHHKWSGKTSIGPEIMVLFSFVTSAIFHHAGNTRSDHDQPKKASSAGGGGSSFMNLFSNMMPSAKTVSPVQKTTPVPVPESVPVPKAEESTPKSTDTVVPKKRKSMKGPSASPFSGLMPSMAID